MQTHVVTGAAGFIGSHLAATLPDRGDRVLGIDAFTARAGMRDSVDRPRALVRAVVTLVVLAQVAGSLGYLREVVGRP